MFRNSYRLLSSVAALLLVAWHPSHTAAFRSSGLQLHQLSSFVVATKSNRASQPSSHQQKQQQKQQQKRHNTRSSELNMFMGSDGGILGVGTPEVATILLVGYFVLGPSDLYKLVREVGKFIQNIRTLGNDLTTSFESNMESQLQLEEIRKAQQELNDAFSFRRTINTNEDLDAFSTTVDSERPGMETAAAVSGTVGGGVPEGTTGKKKKIRRRVRKKVTTETNPDELEMPMAASSSTSSDPFVQEYTPEEQAQIDAEFDKYTLDTTPSSPSATGPSWYDDEDDAVSSDSKSPIQQPTAAASSRFQQQLSGGWNEQIMNKTEELEPLAKVMDMLALLEEEKIANQQRLEEEFRRRKESEEEFYQKQRKLLEEAAAQVQANAFVDAGKDAATKTS